MKKILILLFVCFSIHATAQTQKEQVDRLVSRERVSTGILYNRVMPWAGLHIFGQNGRKDTSSLKHFKQSIYEMEVASNQKGDATYSFILKNWIYHQNKQNIMPIGILHHAFEYSPDIAIENLQDSTFVPPSVLKINKLTTFIVAPLSENPLYVGKPIQVELRESLIFDNTSEKLVSLQADFGEGKSSTFQKGQTFTLSYASAGTKTIRFVGKFSNGTEKVTFAKIEVKDNNTASRVGSVPPCILLSGGNTIKSTIPFTPYEPEPFPNAPAEVEIGYYYANGKGCSGPTTKPILILDGFDPQDKRKIVNSVNDPDPEVIYDKLDYNNRANNLGKELRAQGYDVIVANFPKYLVGVRTVTTTATIPIPAPPFVFTISTTVSVPVYRDGGADYIERNAMGIIAVIQQLNTELQNAGSTEQLTIVGPSMGGLISRYALAYMEKQAQLNPTNISWRHNTKLWVSLDSPHNGANISIGLQRFLYFFGVTLNDDETKKALREQLDSPAARQQLLDHYKSIGSQNHITTPDFYRAIFINNLTTNGLSNSGGFPTQLRKVAIANGSQNGILSGYAGQHVFQVRGYLYNGFFNVNLLQVAEGNIRLGGSYGTVANSFNGYKHSRSDHLNSTINNSTSLDFSPGGTYEMFGEVQGSTPTGNSIIKPAILGVPFAYLLGFASRIEADCYKVEGCFIPTKSALAYKGANLDWGQGVSDH